jgi:predicted nucleic acid-binding protein
MTPALADTSYYLALVNPVDPRHDRAVDLAENHLGRVVVTEFVLGELGNSLSKGADRLVFLALLEDLRADSATTIVPANAALFQQGVELFASRPDKDWSLVDCISFVVMKVRRLKNALSADRHFVQAGFRALLREA